MSNQLTLDLSLERRLRIAPMSRETEKLVAAVNMPHIVVSMTFLLIQEEHPDRFSSCEFIESVAQCLALIYYLLEVAGR